MEEDVPEVRSPASDQELTYLPLDGLFAVPSPLEVSFWDVGFGGFASCRQPLCKPGCCGQDS